MDKKSAKSFASKQNISLMSPVLPAALNLIRAVTTYP